MNLAWDLSSPVTESDAHPVASAPRPVLTDSPLFEPRGEPLMRLGLGLLFSAPVGVRVVKGALGDLRPP